MRPAIERSAEAAYSIARFTVDPPPGVGRLLLRLFGQDSVVLEDRGVAAGRSLIKFETVPGLPGQTPITVHIARRQSRSGSVMAGARACARYVAWHQYESWTNDRLDAVALAIVMPRQFLAARPDEGPEQIAMCFRLDVELVHERLRQLRGAARQSKRPAPLPPNVIDFASVRERVLARRRRDPRTPRAL